jgi:hypothetical protein
LFGGALGKIFGEEKDDNPEEEMDLLGKYDGYLQGLFIFIYFILSLLIYLVSCFSVFVNSALFLLIHT